MFLLLWAIGLFNVLAPRAAWYLSYGWRFKDAEPSDAALMMARIGGVIAIIIGFCVMAG